MAQLIDARKTATLLPGNTLTPEARAAEVAGTSELAKGWRAAGLSEQGNSLLFNAAKAYRDGDAKAGQALEAEGARVLQEARRWAPTTQNFTDINDVASAGRWAAGALGNVRSSIAPAAAGLAGGVVGGLATRSARGAQLGAGLASSLAGYDQMANEAAGAAMTDPVVRSKRSYDEIVDASRASGALQAPLEGLMPAMTAGAVLGLGKAAAKRGVAATIAKNAGEGALGEFATEGTQDLVGQGTQQYLRDEAVGQNLNYEQAFNSGMAGAVVGGAMGGVGGAAQAFHNTRAGAQDVVEDVAKNPRQVADAAIAGLGDLAGKGFNHFEDYINKRSVDRERAAFTGGLTPAEQAMDPMALTEARRVNADAYAAKVLRDQNLYSEDEVRFANEYAQARDPWTYAQNLGAFQKGKEESDSTQAIADELNGTETKKSKMRVKSLGDGITFEVPESSIPESGDPPVTGKVLNDNTPEFTDRAPQDVDVSAAKLRMAEAQRKAEEQDIPVLADIWRKQGIEEGIIDNVSPAAEPAQQQAAVAIMKWVTRGFKGADDELMVPESLIRRYGKDTPTLIQNAYKLAVSQGIVDDEVAKHNFKQIKEQLAETINTRRRDAKMIFDNMTPIARERFKQAIGKADAVDQLMDVGRDLRAIANGGQISKQDEAHLDSWFGPQKNTVLDHFYKEKKVEDVAEASIAQDKIDTEGDSSINEDNPSAQVTRKVEYAGPDANTEYFDARDEAHAKKLESSSKNAVLTVAERLQKRIDFAKANNQLDKLPELEARLKDVGVDGDGVSRKVEHIGMVDREVEKAEAKLGRPLTEDERFALQANLVEQHDGMRAPDALPEGAGPEQTKAHGKAVDEYRKRVTARAIGLNKRFKTMRLTAEEMAWPGVNFTPEQVNSIHHKDRDLSGPKATIQHGVLLFDNGNKKPFNTSASALLRLMHRVTDGTDETTTEDFGGDAASLKAKLTDAIGSLMSSHGFTKVGYIKHAGGPVTWMKSADRLPRDFVLGKKEGRPVTIREADEQDAKMKTEALGSPERFAAMANRLKDHIEDMTNGFPNIKRRAIAKAIGAYRKGSPSLMVSFYNATFKPTGEEATTEKNLTTSEVEKNGGRALDADGSEITANTTLREDPARNIGENAPIHRDERGFVKSNSPETVASGMAGREGVVKNPKAEPKEGGTFKEEKPAEVGAINDEMADTVTALRNGVPSFMASFRKLKTSGQQRAVAALEKLADYKLVGIKIIEPSFDDKRAQAIITRAKNAIELTRAIVYGKEVSDGLDKRDAGRSAQGSMVQVDHENVRGKADAVRVGSSETAKDRGAVAGEVRGHEGVAEGASSEKRDGEAVRPKFAVGGLTVQEGENSIWLDDQKFDKLNQDEFSGILFSEVASDSMVDRARKMSSLLNNLSDPDMLLDDFYMLTEGLTEREVKSELEELGYSDADIQDFIRDVTGQERVDFVSKHGLQPDNPNQGKLFSKQTADAKRATDEQVAAAEAHILKTLGKTVEVRFLKEFADKTSGSWIKNGAKDGVRNLIKIAKNSDVLGTAYHESMHEFFSMLGEHGAKDTLAMLNRVGSNKIILNQLTRLLDGHKAAQEQLSNPEEVVAYAYQFWKAGLLNIGTETKTWFQKIESFFRKTFNMLTEQMKTERDMAMLNGTFRAFDSGAVANDQLRAVIIKQINDRAEQHNKALEAVGETWSKVANTAGKFVLSAEAMMDATGNKYMAKISRQFNQQTGEAMDKTPSFFEAVASHRNRFMNRFENTMQGVSQEDMEFARKHLSLGTTPTDENSAGYKVVTEVRKLLEDVFEYAQKKKISRWDDGQAEWVGIQHRKNYFPRVWDTDALMKDGVKFKQVLMEKYKTELQAIADKANAEVEAEASAGPNTASDTQLKKLADNRQVVTQELVADAILARLLNSGGYVELEESMSSLGMSPVATAVNRRTLSWIKDEDFDDFKSKDLVKTLTGYVSNMVKRGEYTERFGNGGEHLRSDADRAMLLEMDGEELVKQAEKALPDAITSWKKDPKGEPFPTLRSVGEDILGRAKGKAVLTEARGKAVKKLEQGYRAIMAMEGTLGADIRQNVRSFNNWMTTYQNYRLLSTTLFSSFNDVVGLMVNGGEMSDAWDAFVAGIKEVKLRWFDEKSNDKKAQRAEMWGTVDAGSFLDALGNTYGSSFMTGAARRMNDNLFKWNGMEAWNRAMRITATSVAERMIKQMQKDGIDRSDKAAVARLEELFGKDFDPKDIKLDADGELDIDDVRNQAAVAKWVNGAILRPNAAQRTIWGSDPHFQLLWHMKTFTYTFQAVILSKAVEQAKLGNFRPALVVMAGYTPVIIAADVIKEMLIPGGEPPWMKGGMAGFIQHGVDKAGFFGVGQLGYDAFAKDYGMSLAGPTIGQVLHAPIDPVGQTTLGALPFGSLAKRAAY